MFKAKLAQPRRKKRPRYTRKLEDGKVISSPPSPVLQQPFPIPIASLTGIKANNSVWRWYRGNLKKRKKKGVQIDAFVSPKLVEGEDETHDDSSNMYHYVEISPDNEAHSILAQMGFFGEKDENLVTYRNASKIESKGYDTFVIMEDFEPKIVLSEQNNCLRKDNKTIESKVNSCSQVKLIKA